MGFGGAGVTEHLKPLSADAPAPHQRGVESRHLPAAPGRTLRCVITHLLTLTQTSRTLTEVDSGGLTVLRPLTSVLKLQGGGGVQGGGGGGGLIVIGTFERGLGEQRPYQRGSAGARHDLAVIRWSHRRKKSFNWSQLRDTRTHVHAATRTW